MKIEINLKIILLFILFILLNKFDIYVIFIVFILLHELSHMLCGMVLGFEPKTLKINPLGVSIEFYNYDENTNSKRYKRMITYLAGPITNFIFATAFYFIDIYPILKMKIIYTNILIGIFNMIPILPLDGGKIFKEGLQIFYPHKVASHFMICGTKVVLICITLAYSVAIFQIKNIAIFLLILYLWYLYLIEEKREQLLLKVYDTIEKNQIKD